MYIKPIPSFAGFTEFTPTLPNLYWDVYSQEERIKALCMEYCKLVAYVTAIADTVNATAAVVNRMENELPELVAETIKTDPQITEAIRQGVAEYIQSLTKGTTYADINNYGFLHDLEQI